MSDPNDPTRSQVPPRDDPATASAVTHSHAGDPGTATAHPNASLDAPEPLPLVPGFDVTRELGGGGMGVVYEARQTRLNRPVALKVLRGSRGSKQDIVRFLTEAEAVAAVKHPHIVQVFEFGQDGDRPFMVLELLTGGTLSERLQSSGRLEPHAAALLVGQLADAVQAAHDLGIVHRDLKPSNVLFDDRGEAKVTDFGLAKRTGGADLTRTQAVMGTPAYMAPEQARGDAKFVGPAADVWALGAILYECVTGKRPFEADDTWALLRKVTDEAPPRPRSHAPGLPRDLELIALKCLEKKPADRYPTAAALAEDLRRFRAGQPVSVRPAGPTERFVKWVRRNPVVAGFTAALVLVAVVGFAGVTWALWQTEKREKELAKSNGDLNLANGDLQLMGNKLAATVLELRISQIDLDDAAKEAKQKATESEERGYLSDVALAHQLWKANDLAGMTLALERCPPARRKWEWHYLKGLSRTGRVEHIADSPPLALAYSRDGKLLAWVTLAGTLTVRDLAAGTDRHTILGQKNESNRVTTLAFHPKGGELAYVLNGRARVVDLATGKWSEVKGAAAPAGNPGNPSGSPTIAVGYSPDGRLLTASLVKGTKPRWLAFAVRDAVAGKPIATLEGYEEPEGVFPEVASAAFSPNGQLFAASVVDSGMRVSDGKPLSKEPRVFTPRAFVWHLESQTPLGQREVGSDVLGGIAFDDTGWKLGYGGRGWVADWDPNLKLPGQPTFSGHAGSVPAVAFDKNKLIWSGGEDKLILARDRFTGEERFALRGCTRGVLRLAVSPDGREVAAGCGDPFALGGVVNRFDVAALATDVWRDTNPRTHLSLTAALAPDGSRFAALSLPVFDERPESRRFLTRDVFGGRERSVTPAGRWFAGAFAPDGRLFTIERETRPRNSEQIRVIGADGKPGPVIDVPPGAGRLSPQPAVVACTPDGRTIAVVSANDEGPEKLRARLRTWDANTRTPGVTGEADLRHIVPEDGKFAILHPQCVAVARDGKRLAAALTVTWGSGAGFESRGVVVVWDLSTGTAQFQATVAVPLRAVAFDSRGRVAAAGGGAAGGMVFRWDAGDGNGVVRLDGHTRPILSLAFGPDDRLATGGGDRVVKVWDLENKREVLTLDGFAREVTHLAFAPGGALVAATGLDLFTAMGATGVPSDWPAAELRVFRAAK